MNPLHERTRLSSALVSFNLTALPDTAHELTLAALGKGATKEMVHKAAHAIADEAPVTCLQGVLAALILMANPDVDVLPLDMSTGGKTDNQGD